MNQVLEAALAYAKAGWRVLPVIAGGKVPATQHGVKDATTDEGRIRAWFDSERGGRLNIGVACGRESGIVVVDIDPRNGGSESWELWTQYHGGTPDGPVAYTAGGGQHYVCRYEDGIRSAKLADGIDLLSDGRYFVAYPSTIEGRSYHWEDSSKPVALEEGDEPVAPWVLPDHWRASMVPQVDAGGSGGVADELIRGSRNAGLTAMAGVMRRYGLTEAEILAAISVANETRCEVPLPASEVRAIAQSVARYEPEADVAASAAIGDEAIEALLAAENAARHDYYLTRGTAFLSQPSPIEWAVKGWVPVSGTSMVYGESGSGKTFITLDIACSVASRTVDWCGLPTRHGYAVYLAGEGNYGLRQRVASWAMRHGVSDLDRLLVSNRALDLDDRDAVAQVLRAVRDIVPSGEEVSLVVIDTVNNHMAGDENSAKDVRTLFGAVNTVAAALACPVVLNHHVGNNVEARHRARGSSAFKASLDSSILVENRDGAIAVSCTKMKDGPQPAPIHGRIEAVELPWQETDGQPIQGAVFAQGDAPDEGSQPRQDRAERRRERQETDRLERWRSMFERAWYASGAELHDGQPYLTRSALRDWLVVHMRDVRTSTIEQHLKATAREGSMVRDLLDSGYAEAKHHGWVVVDDVHLSALLASRTGG